MLLSFPWHDSARICGSVFTQRGQTALALRVIPVEIPSFTDLGLPFAAEWDSEGLHMDFVYQWSVG
jgi:Tfp pilus assembly pilus retraction ATPase PilT